LPEVTSYGVIGKERVE